MNTSVFHDLEKRFRRKLKHTARFYPVDLHCHSPLSPCFGKKDGICQDDIDATRRTGCYRWMRERPIFTCNNRPPQMRER